MASPAPLIAAREGVGPALHKLLGDDLIVRKLKFLDGALDQLEHIDEEGRRAELDARFALQSGEIRRLFLLLELFLWLLP